MSKMCFLRKYFKVSTISTKTDVLQGFDYICETDLNKTSTLFYLLTHFLIKQYEILVQLSLCKRTILRAELVSQQPLIIVTALCDCQKASLNGHHGRHYLDVTMT